MKYFSTFFLPIFFRISYFFIRCDACTNIFIHHWHAALCADCCNHPARILTCNIVSVVFFSFYSFMFFFPTAQMSRLLKCGTFVSHAKQTKKMPPTKPTHNQSNYRIQPNPFRTVDTYKYSTMQKPSKQQKVLIARVSVWSILYRLLLHFLFLSLHFFVLAFFPFACLFSIFDSHNFFCVFARCAHLFVVVVIIAFSLRSLCTLDAQQEMFCHS